MPKFLKKLLLFFLIFNYIISFGQNKIIKSDSVNSDIFTVFNSFFDKEIKHQGIKGDWIFKLNEITGLHKFDYNADNFIDVLMEFNAIPVEGGGVTYYFAVLFSNNTNNGYQFVDYIDTDNLTFKEFTEQQFIFSNKKATKNDKKYKLVNLKFIKTD